MKFQIPMLQTLNNPAAPVPTTETSLDLFAYTTGPTNARIAIVGEAWGGDEAAVRKPFVGSSGLELNRMLAEGRIARDDCFVTNCVSAQPPKNEIWNFFHSKTEAKELGLELYRGCFPSTLMRTSLERLYAQLSAVRPQVILALGNTAFWALSNSYRVANIDGKKMPTGIGDFRGSMLYTDPALPLPQTKLIPLMHPAAILRQWSNRPIFVHDLRIRVARALNNDWAPKIRPQINHRPTFDEAVAYFEGKLSLLDSGRKLRMANDIETRMYNITCIGFATDKHSAFVLPLVNLTGDPTSPLTSYWTTKQEARLTQLFCRMLPHPNIELVGQNYMYDMQYLHEFYGIVPRLYWDTMGAQHLAFPGTQKDLGYLSSLYCDYHRYWKDDNKEWDTKMSLDDHLRYNGEDCIRTFEIAERQHTVLEQLGVLHLWPEELEKHQLAFEMSTRGVLADTHRRTQLTLDMSNAIDQREQFLQRVVPQALIDQFLDKPSKTSWTRSPAQQKLLFYDILGLPPQVNRKTKAVSLDKEALPKLRKALPLIAPIVNALLEIRSLNVYASTFLAARLGIDGRMHTTFQPFGTETYRWSSNTNPFNLGCNFQNLPTGNEE